VAMFVDSGGMEGEISGRYRVRVLVDAKGGDQHFGCRVPLFVSVTRPA
jgi:hypothetical protein